MVFMMSQKTIILTVLLFALIVVGMFTYARLRHHEIKGGGQAFNGEGAKLRAGVS